MKPLRLSIILALLLVPALVWAAPDGPGTKAVKSANDTISGLLKQKAAPGSDEEKKLAAKVTTSVRDVLDVDELGKRALVDHWKDIPAAKQKELLDTLRALLEDNYVKGLRANLEYTVDYTGESTQKDNSVLVTTVVKSKRKGRPVEFHIDYVLTNVNGKLKVYDMNTDGVGLVENYRAQFNKIIAKDGVDGLIAKMKKKREQG
ncbi:MAG TPA: ABC transporter substrate-binding protein [Kofleriaceae bacterium]|nr:ABC transporter substrate-binding protein [Kofleriaceae bacterium]